MNRTKSWFPVLLSLLVLGVFLAVPQAASASGDGVTVTPDCMQKTFGTPVTNSNRLNCTANDIKISKATSVSPPTCIEGTYFDLTATFETVVTANARYDAGFFFRTDGGPNARGDGTDATGTCSLSQLDGSGQGLNLDLDSCFDLNAGTYSLTFTIPNVFCHDADGDGKLNLPNCTSWHSNQGTVCTAGDSIETDARPDTKAKCVCDDTFQVPVTVESPNGAVTKTAISATVTYGVTVTNNSATRSVTVDSLIDAPYGDITTSGHDGIQSTTCASAKGATLAPGASTSPCTFTVAATSSSSPQADTITAHLTTTTAPIQSVDVTGSATVVVSLDGQCTP